jgi:defect-in-organelle-trafficking protein DotD
MNTKLLTTIVCCLFVSACVEVPPAHPTQTQSQTYKNLAQSADSVANSLVELQMTEQAAYPPVSVSEPPNPASYGMAVPVAAEWNGPIEPFVKQVVDITGYKLRVVGKPPVIPIIVSISEKNAPIGEVLRNVSYQCGRYADIVVFPSSKVVELRYANV